MTQIGQVLRRQEGFWGLNKMAGYLRPVALGAAWCLV
jgi:hypothetical protein